MHFLSFMITYTSVYIGTISVLPAFKNHIGSEGEGKRKKKNRLSSRRPDLTLQRAKSSAET